MESGTVKVVRTFHCGRGAGRTVPASRRTATGAAPDLFLTDAAARALGLSLSWPGRSTTGACAPSTPDTDSASVSRGTRAPGRPDFALPSCRGEGDVPGRRHASTASLEPRPGRRV